jgi:acetyl esterase/lipase
MSMLDESFSWPLWPDVSGKSGASDHTEIVFQDAAAPVHGRIVTDVFHPRVFAYVPAKPSGAAALVLAGGGYTSLVVGKEGVAVAAWLNSLGMHAFVLVHRFPCARFTMQGRSGTQAPVDDAREAMRQIRARAAEWQLDARRIGVVGFSSGGHLAACLVAHYPATWSEPPSAHAPLSTRPDFLVEAYGPISTNAAGRTVIPDKPPLPPPEKQALYEALQPDAQLIDEPPPAFIVYTADDAVVPVENAYRLGAAFRARGVHAETHVFAEGPHGFALRRHQLPVDEWPHLCAAWLRRRGLAPPAS